MGTSLASYRDPGYAPIEADVEQQLGLPTGLLASIRTKGERSNADQVSSAGAKTVYQVIPSTRAAFKEKYGVDAYASPRDAAMVAGLHLRDSLQRNGGDQRAAVGEYVGGTDRKNWGRTVDGYVRRVTGAGVQARGKSTFDRVAAQAQSGPSMEKVYQAYRSGKMTPQERAAYENAVINGQVVMRPGWKIDRKPSAPVLPQHLIDAYNSRQMDDDPQGRQMIEQAVARGEARLPEGVRLQRPAPRTVGEELGMGVRSIVRGATGLADFVTAPVNAISREVIKAATGSDPGMTPLTDLANTGADKVGLPTPESPSEHLADAVVQGGTQGLATAGLGTVAAPLKALAASPVLDTISGATSGYSQESARQAGAGPVAQIAAGLAGGALPVGIAGAASRIRAPRSLAETVAATPREAVIDEGGNLTPHGQEVATHHGATPAEIHEAYEAPPAVKAGTANEQVEPAQARAAEAGAQTVRRHEGVDYPVEIIERGVVDAEGKKWAKVRGTDSGDVGYVPDSEIVETPTARPQEAKPAHERELPPTPSAPDGHDATLPATALARVKAGEEVGVDYSRGQATKNFDIQDTEQRLRNSNGPAGEQMRQFVANQVEQVKAAVADFRKGFGDTAATPEERGAVVQDAVRELRANGQKGVTALYKEARDLGQSVPLDPAPIREAYDRLMVEANVPDKVKAELTQEMARYGLIGKAEGTAENGVTTVKLAGDPEGGRKITFYGKPDSLRLDNAEDLRKVVSGLYQEDGARKLTTILKRAIDDATESAATKLAQAGEDGAGVPAALGKARAAHVEQVQTFKAGDVVQKIADWKKGQQDVTGALTPEQVMRAALGSTSDLRRVKAVLLTKATPASKAAWRAIQAHGLAELFAKATTRSTNAGGEITEAISGAKLRSALAGDETAKMKVLLDPADFNRLMKLRRVIEDVTVPIGGTVNHSNSGNLIMRLVKDADNQFTAAASAAGFAVGGPVGAMVSGGAARMVAPALKAAKQAKAEAETLEGVTAYTSEKAASDDAGGTEAKPGLGAKAREAGAQSLRGFIDIYSSPRVLAPILASTEGAQQ